MKLELIGIQSMLPGREFPDTPSFRVYVELDIAEIAKPGSELFSVYVCSADQLKTDELGFAHEQLVLDSAAPDAIRNRVEQLLKYAEPLPDWEAVMSFLTRYLRWVDDDLAPNSPHTKP